MTGADADPRASLWPNYAPPADLVFSHGAGCELFTESGDAYLDFMCGIAVTSFGHAHPHLVRVLEEQSRRLWHVSNLFRIPQAERLARRLTDHCFGSGVFFANSGTEAIEAGIKAIRGYQVKQGRPHRYRLIGFSNSFHGRTLAALAAAGNKKHTSGFIPTDYGFDQVEWGQLDALEAAIGEQTAGIILEPIQGEGGIRPARAEFLRAVKSLCQEHGLLLLFDEVQCGIGRSGKLFAHQHFGVDPDVMALAKGLGGGFPIGACVTSAEVAEAMVVGSHGSTFGGNPLATAVGNGVMDLLLEPGLLEEVSARGEFLRRGLEQLSADYPQLISGVEGLGLMLGLKCVIPNTQLMSRLREDKMLVVSAGGNMLRLLPPLNIETAQLQRGLDIIASSLQSLAGEAAA